MDKRWGLEAEFRRMPYNQQQQINIEMKHFVQDMKNNQYEHPAFQ